MKNARRPHITLHLHKRDKPYKLFTPIQPEQGDAAMNTETHTAPVPDTAPDAVSPAIEPAAPAETVDAMPETASLTATPVMAPETLPDAAPAPASEAAGHYVEEGVTLSEISVSEEPASPPSDEADTAPLPVTAAVPVVEVEASPAPVQEKPGRKGHGKAKSGKSEKAEKEKAEKTEKAEKAEKPEKPKKDSKQESKRDEKAKPVKKSRLVRDSFTMPENEYALFEQLKKRLLAQGVAAKKSELMRAGILMLASLDDAALQTTVQSVEIIKTGRPARHGH